MRIRAFGDDLVAVVDHVLAQDHVNRPISRVLDLRRHQELRAPAGNFASDECSPLRDMDLLSADELDAAVDASAFVEPALTERRVGAHGDDVGPPS